MPKEHEKCGKRKKKSAKMNAGRMSYKKIEREMNLHYGFLVIKEAELEKRLTDTAMKMNRKREKQIRRLGLVV